MKITIRYYIINNTPDGILDMENAGKIMYMISQRFE
jgi:hypothetical protein